MTDLLSSIKARLRNALGEQVEAYTDPNGDLRATFPPGRLAVAAGQTISSAWGNTTYDQTMEVFASASDRTNQWPSPNEGAQSWLMDSHTPWVYRAGAWHGIPMGYVGSTIGPATTVDGATTAANVITLAANVVASRRYRLSATIWGQQITAASTGSYFQITGLIDSAQGRFVQAAPAVSQYIMGSAVFTYTAATTGVQSWIIQAVAGAGALRTLQNQATLLLEDMGS